MIASRGVASLEGYLAPAAAPAAAQLLANGNLLVTGHFDDPTAMRCHVISVGAGFPSPSQAEVI